MTKNIIKKPKYNIGGLQQYSQNYIDVLSKLNKHNIFGNLVIYPLIGVDGIIADFVKVVGLNKWGYSNEEIIRQVSPILPNRFLNQLKKKINNNLIYYS